MLRHYDEIGLLRPESVDPLTGYRSYSPEQLFTLNRLVALKDLGFGLDQVRTLMAATMSDDKLRDLLERRRSALEEEVRAASTRLAAVELRLRLIEQEKTMPTDYVVKNLPATRLVAVTRTVPRTAIAQHVGPMFDEVAAAIGHASGALATPIATYEPDGEDMIIVAGYATDIAAPDGFLAIELPGCRAVCGVHLGSMATIEESWQALMHWAGSNGHDFAGPCRELYVRAESENQADWVTELQQPIAG